MTARRVLVTGAAGFIGFHLVRSCLARGDVVCGVDNLNDYYDVTLKQARLALLREQASFSFEQMTLEDAAAVDALMEHGRFDVVVHLAAQAGVRYSLKNPRAYVAANIVAFTNLLEACRQFRPSHLVFASSSSVYGANTRTPFSVHDNVDHPLSFYAATKKANELMAHAYANLHAIPMTGLRFFTVYGPWGRPDMAYFSFTKAILEDRPIDVFNHGRMQRDFTYIDDIIEGVQRVMAMPAQPNPAWSGDRPDPSSSFAPYRIFNIGNNNPVELGRFVAAIEAATGKTARKNYLDMQPGDLPASFADIDDLASATGFKPATSIEAGICRFVEWYRRYYGA